MALVTTAQLMVEAGVPYSNLPLRARYDALRIGVEQAVKSYCKWELEQATATDYPDGNGQPDLPLRRPYVSSVTSVYLDSTGYYGQSNNAFPAASLLTAGTDYALVLDDGSDARGGRLRRLGLGNYWYWPSDLIYAQYPGGITYAPPPWWPVGSGNLKVTYTFGFPSNLGISGAAYAAGTGTYTTAAPHGLTVGRQVTVTGILPDGFNGVLMVQSVPTPTTFTALLPADPGSTYASGGVADCVPQDLKIAVTIGVAIAVNTTRYGFPLTSENLGAHSYSLSLQRDPEFLTCRSLLGRYRDSSL